MPTLADLQVSSKIRALVFGKYKIGKTVGAATFPRPNFIMFDRDGMLSLINPKIVAKYGARPEIQYQEFNEHAKMKLGLPQAHNAFDDACRYFDECMSKDKVDTFDTWVIDSGSTLTEAARLKAVILLGDKAAMGSVLSKTWDTAQKTGLLIPKMQDFGAERSMVEQFIDMVLGTDKNVLLLCHERESYNQDGTIDEIVPLLTGQSKEIVPNKFSEVWRVVAKKEGPKTTRVIRTQPHGGAYCGTRLGVPDETPFEYAAIINSLKRGTK